ncbi:MAG: hypothetical protein ACD_12C00525G0002 [uncultured bacterium]|nr:MAG: hypothetical protein ACD_12C00525G0002 [uncultured bacterium]
MAKIINWRKIESRIGLIEKVEDFYLEDKHYYLLQINFGKALGFKKSVAQMNYFYQKGDLIGKTIVAVTNIAPFQIGPWISEVKVLTISDASGNQLLVVPEKPGIEIGKTLNI